MKVVNVVLSILILLLAAASAAFSYFLFEKRGQLTGGWNKMAAAINATAVEMDRNSGPSLRANLPPRRSVTGISTRSMKSCRSWRLRRNS